MIYLASYNPNPIKSDLPPPVFREVFDPTNSDIFSWADALDSGLPILRIGQDPSEVF